jgi:hypothetical protein
MLADEGRHLWLPVTEDWKDQRVVPDTEDVHFTGRWLIRPERIVAYDEHDLASVHQQSEKGDRQTGHQLGDQSATKSHGKQRSVSE